MVVVGLLLHFAQELWSNRGQARSCSWPGRLISTEGSRLLLTVYQRVLREQFVLLPLALRRFLGQSCGRRASGRVQVTRPAGGLRYLVGSLLGVPPAGDYDLCLEVVPRGSAERWVRHFGQHILETVHSEHRGLLLESSGPASIGFELTVGDGVLVFRRRRAWVLGIPLPLGLAPEIQAENWPSDCGGWHVRVRVSVPLLGQVAEYVGEVRHEEAVSSDDGSAGVVGRSA